MTRYTPLREKPMDDWAALHPQSELARGLWALHDSGAARVSIWKHCGDVVYLEVRRAQA